MLLNSSRRVDLGQRLQYAADCHIKTAEKLLHLTALNWLLEALPTRQEQIGMTQAVTRDWGQYAVRTDIVHSTAPTTLQRAAGLTRVPAAECRPGGIRASTSPPLRAARQALKQRPAPNRLRSQSPTHARCPFSPSHYTQAPT